MSYSYTVQGEHPVTMRELKYSQYYYHTSTNTYYGLVLCLIFQPADESYLGYLLSHVVLGKRWRVIVVKMLITHVVVPLVKVDCIILIPIWGPGISER